MAISGNSVKIFPKRSYQATLPNTNPEGYNQAVGHLNGEDNVMTPLWWAKKQ